MYRDNDKSGGSVITERLYIDVKQDFFIKKRHSPSMPIYVGNVDLTPPFRLTTHATLESMGWRRGLAMRNRIREALAIKPSRTHHEVAALGVQ